MTQKSLVVLLIGIAGIGLLSGCATQTHAEAKQAAYDRWSAARAGILYSLAVQQFETGDLDNAERTCHQGLSAEPKNDLFYQLTARVMIERGQLEKALYYLNTAVELNSKDSETHYLLGVVYQRWEEYDAARDAYEKAYDCAKDDVKPLLAVAEMLVKVGQPKEAVRRLEEKLVYFEHNAAIRVTLARIEMMMGENAKAVTRFQEAALLAPDDNSVAEYLAIAEYRAGKYQDAIFHLTKLVGQESYADRSDILLTLADCHMARNDAREAGRIYMQLARADSQNVTYWIKLGQAAWVTRDIGTLRESAGMVLKLDPERSEGYLLRGMAYRLEDQPKAAVKQFELASSKNPKDSVPYLLKGMTLEYYGDLRGAAGAYQTALRVSPKDARAKELLEGLTASVSP